MSREGRSNFQGLIEQTPLQCIPCVSRSGLYVFSILPFSDQFCFHTFVIWQLNSSPSPQLLNIGIGKIRQGLPQILFSERPKLLKINHFANPVPAQTWLSKQRTGCWSPCFWVIVHTTSWDRATKVGGSPSLRKHLLPVPPPPVTSHPPLSFCALTHLWKWIDLPQSWFWAWVLCSVMTTRCWQRA